MDTTTPTPTPTGTGTPTPTPTPGNSNIYALLANPTSQTCALGAVGLAWNTSFVTIVIDGTTFTPDWGHASMNNVSVLVAPNGTLTGNDFTSNWTICEYSGLANITTQHIYTWTGTFTNGGANFTSTLHDEMHNKNGNSLADCASVTQPLSDCTTPGINWTIAGTRQ